MKLNQEIFDISMNKAEHGYTLIELIMVIVFLGIALATTLTMMSSGVSKSLDTESLSIATMMAEQKMEEIRGDKNGRGYSYLVNNNYPSEANIDGYSGFTRAVLITAYQNYKEISVTVSHADLPDFNLVTQMANY